jgi:hypothetical protein
MDAQGRAEEIRDQLLAEWPDLFVEVEDGDAPILKVYGATKLHEEQLARAEALIGDHHEIVLQAVESVYCSKSVPVKTGRQIDQPVGNAAGFIDEDGRGVALMCNNEDGHTAHDWDDYEPLPK